MGSSEMGLFRNLERRHMVSNRGRTTIALEPAFWQAADIQAQAKGMDWRQWVIDQLDGRPDRHGRASWLRVAILKAETLR